MINQGRAFEMLAEFITSLLTPYDIDLALDDLANRVRDLLDIAGVGVALIKDEKLQLATALPDEMRALENVQVETQRGPCIDALRSDEFVAVNNLRDASWRDKWPQYCRMAEEVGVHAVAGIPMRIKEQSIGAVNLYSKQVKTWSDQELFYAQTFANAASIYLLNASAFDQERELATYLQRALDSRVLIEQAKGITAEANGIKMDAAFELIRNRARSRNASIRSVAEAIVSLGLRL